MRIFRLLASHSIFLFKLNKSGFDECYQSTIKWGFEKSKSQYFQGFAGPHIHFLLIPTQLISSIYELFFHLSDEDDEKGTYYTPLHLVNLVMDEVYPWEGEYKDTSFFDPSCGSGIFLVEAYRRLVCRWMSQNDVHTINCDQLNLLLKNSIFGVDINEEAIRVASFSLSLPLISVFVIGTLQTAILVLNAKISITAKRIKSKDMLRQA